jgi:uncharacterized protein (TIGR02118 family)
MIKVSVMYPYKEGAIFDHEYYRTTHMPLVASSLGDACIRYEIDKGIPGGTLNPVPVYVAMCHIYSDSLEAYEQAMTAHRDRVRADIPKFTNLAPVIQISEVVR